MNSPQFPRPKYFRKQQRISKNVDKSAHEQNDVLNSIHNESLKPQIPYSREDLLKYGHTASYLKQSNISIAQEIKEDNFSGLSGNYFFPFTDIEFDSSENQLDSAKMQSSQNLQGLFVSIMKFLWVCLKTLFFQVKETMNYLLTSISQIDKKQ